MMWLETGPDGKISIWQQEPGATMFQQITLTVIGLLPIQWLL